MQFEAIIHNLTPEQDGYKECQLYDNLISSGPKNGNCLSTKLSMIRAWERPRKQALETAHKKLGV